MSFTRVFRFHLETADQTQQDAGTSILVDALNFLYRLENLSHCAESND